MATVRRRGERWQVIVQVRHKDGTRTSRTESFDTEADAKLHAHRLEFESRGGKPVAGKDAVGAVVDTWLELQRHQLPSTYDAMRINAQRAVKALGSVPAAALTPQLCELAWARMLNRYKPSTVKATRKTLSSAMGWAHQMGIIPTNPVAASKVRTPRAALLDEQEILTPAELAQVLQWIGPSPWPTMWRLLADTGLRQGEARVLRWRDVDLARSRVKVVATATRGVNGGEVVGEPKSRASRRNVPLTAATVAALKRHKAQQADALGVAAGRADGFVFAKEGGGFWSGREVTHRWQDVRMDLELPGHLTLHNLRHTYASTLLAGGMPLVRVAALLGHTPLICARTYAHWIDDGSSEAAEMIERARNTM